MVSADTLLMVAGVSSARKHEQTPLVLEELVERNGSTVDSPQKWNMAP